MLIDIVSSAGRAARGGGSAVVLAAIVALIVGIGAVAGNADPPPRADAGAGGETRLGGPTSGPIASRFGAA